MSVLYVGINTILGRGEMNILLKNIEIMLSYRGRMIMLQDILRSILEVRSNRSRLLLLVDRCPGGLYTPRVYVDYIGTITGLRRTLRRL